MFGVSEFHLRKCPASSNTFEFLDPSTGRPIGIVSCVAVPRHLPSFWEVVGLRLPAPERRPRLIVRRAEDGAVVLTLRKSSGLLYDSRRVYGGNSELLAHLVGHSKSSLHEGFGIIDLRGVPENYPDISVCPWLGSVQHLGDSYQLRLIQGGEVGSITKRLSADDRAPGEPATLMGYDLLASPGQTNDPLARVLFLACALALAWVPPAG